MLPVYYDGISDELVKIINSNIDDMLDLFITTAEPANFEEMLPIIFPKHYARNTENAKKVLYTFRDMVNDLYKRDFIKPIYEYALYHLIDWWFEVTEEVREEGLVTFKERLEGYICKNEDEEFIVESIDDIFFYLEDLFADHDFLDIHKYISMYNSNSDFVENFCNINLVEYVELMPDDIKEHFISNFHFDIADFERVINNFEELLNLKKDDDESIFHDYINNNPVLLDVYGEAISKPRFYYPPDESPLGKKYVEPDFIIKYNGNKYKLVELEKPAKKLSTKQGHPRFEVTQTTFQIAEWKNYIENFYHSIKDKFPGICVHSNCSSMVIISRSSQERKDINYMNLLCTQFSCEVITYDDLLERAKRACRNLSALISD